MTISLEINVLPRADKKLKWDENASSPYLAISAKHTIYLHSHSKEWTNGSKEERLAKLHHCSTFLVDVMSKAFQQTQTQSGIICDVRSIQTWLHEVHQEEIREIKRLSCREFHNVDYSSRNAMILINNIWLEKSKRSPSNVPALVFTPEHLFFFHIHPEEEKEGECVEKCINDKHKISQNHFTEHMKLKVSEIECGKSEYAMEMGSIWGRIISEVDESEKEQGRLPKISYIPRLKENLAIERVIDSLGNEFLEKEAGNVTDPSWWFTDNEKKLANMRTFIDTPERDSRMVIYDYFPAVTNHSHEPIPVIQQVDSHRQEMFDFWWNSISNPQSASTNPSSNPYLKKMDTSN